MLNAMYRWCVGVCLGCMGIAGPGGAAASEPLYEPVATHVHGNVYAIIGPLVQRSLANAGLNANYGFVVTPNGVILIDAGASAHSAAMLERAVRAVTPKPIRWVLNTGSQDHRWLGNDYFVRRGAVVHALSGTPPTQERVAAQQLSSLERFVGEQLVGTVPAYATERHAAPEQVLEIDGVTLHWMQTNAHYPGDTMVYLPGASVVFTGDLVFVQRLLGVLPSSNVRAAQAAFQRLVALAPTYVVPGHGQVSTMAQAQHDTGDYYDFLVEHIGSAARDMQPMAQTLDRFAAPAQFMPLQNFEALHRANMNRVFVDIESNP
jgi:glyoxylase-like metal-dependent hydrolase (beta-lactamase superfamily II)